MKSIICMLAALTIGSILVGCQAMPYKPYARNVKVMPKKGGVIALNTNHRNEDRIHAEGMMSRTCAGKTFDILEEGEVVTGTVTRGNERYNRGSQGKQVGTLWGLPVTSGGSDPSTSTSSETTQKKEWQITYKCTNVARTKKIRRKKATTVQ